MGRCDDEEYVTYSVVLTAAQHGVPADTMQIKMRKFKGGGPSDSLKWSSDFQSLAKKKGWTDDQKSRHVIALIEGDLAHEVGLLVDQARAETWSFDQFYAAVGLLSVPEDFSEDLDQELWHMTKRRDESVEKFAQRLRENVRLFAELPQNAEIIPDVQMRRYFKRGMPMSWQDKLAAAGVTPDTYNEMVFYFSRLEKQERLTKVSSTRESRGFHARTDKDQVRHERKNNRKGGYQGKKNSKNKFGGKVGPKTEENEKWCSYHKTRSHNTGDCFTLKKKKEEHKKLEVKDDQNQDKYPTIFKEGDICSEYECKEEESSGEDEYKLIGLLQRAPEEHSAPLRITV